MSIKEAICDVFCEGVRVAEFEGGFGVSTPYSGPLGDPIGFYVLGPNRSGLYRIVDDALTVAHFESEGATLDSHTRREAFSAMLSEYGAEYDSDFGEIFKEGVTEEKLAVEIVGFAALLLRTQDLALMSHEKVRSTFLEEVEGEIKKHMPEGVTLERDTPVSTNLREVVPDYVLRYGKGPAPVALFIVNSDTKLWLAIHLKMIADHEAREGVSVVAMLERDSSVAGDLRRRADNRLDAVPRYREDEQGAISRVFREATGTPLH